MSPLTPHRLARLAAPLVGLGGLAVLLAGCGGTSGSPAVANIGTTTTPGTTTDQGTAATGGPASGVSAGGVQMRLKGGANVAQFASCMRSNGEPNFPDPNAQGVISINSSSGVDPSSQQFQAAQRACSKYLPNGGQPPSPAEQAKMQQQALKFSACMRSHGLPNFPDPDFGNGNIRIQIGPSSGIDPSSPVFQAARKACQNLLPGKAGPAPAIASTGKPGGSGTAATSGAGGQ